VIFGAHVVLFSADAVADRSFLTDVLGFGSVDAGGGWLIFGLPPAEMAIHPSVAGVALPPAGAPTAELYLMCDDLESEMRTLAGRGVACSAVEEARWGSITKITLPSGGEVGLYQPKHPTAIDRSL
jgi:hypothetical protein